jgi:hypothetical protein
MKTPFDDIACASIPAGSMAQLAGLRCEPGVEVALETGRLWVRFEAGSERVVRGLLPLTGVELFAFRDGVWRRLGESLPAFDFPKAPRFKPLHQVLFPAPMLPLPAGAAPIDRMQLTLTVSGNRSRPTTAMLSRLPALAAWADTVPAAALERLSGLMPDGQVLVIGDRLPALEGSERFWGRLVLAPLGLRPEPDLPEAALREAAGVDTDELLLLRHQRAEAVPRAAFAPLSRAALRLAAREATA